MSKHWVLPAKDIPSQCALLINHAHIASTPSPGPDTAAAHKKKPHDPEELTDGEELSFSDEEAVLRKSIAASKGKGKAKGRGKGRGFGGGKGRGNPAAGKKCHNCQEEGHFA